MADAADKIEEAKEHLAEAADAIGDAALTDASTEAAIEAAEEAREAAEEAADRIAEAAMQAAITQRVEAFHTELLTWRNEADRRLTALETELKAMADKLNNPPAVKVEVTPDPSSILPPSGESEPTVKVEVKPETVDPAKQSAESAARTESAEAPKRTRRFL